MSKALILGGGIISVVFSIFCGVGGAIVAKNMQSSHITYIENELLAAPVVEVKEKLNGWQNEGTSWYYYKDDIKKTGWLQDNDKWYYLGENGKMRTGWVQDKEQCYYLNDEGVMVANIPVDECYLNEEGLIEEISEQKPLFSDDNNSEDNNISNNSSQNNSFSNNNINNSENQTNQGGSFVQDSTEAKNIIYSNDPGDYELIYKGIYSSGEINSELSKLYENFIINEPVHVFHYYDNDTGDIGCIYYVGKNTGTLYRRDGGYHELTNAHIIKNNQIVRVYDWKR